jgi:hypothetical protein
LTAPFSDAREHANAAASIRWPQDTDKQGKEWLAPTDRRAKLPKQNGSLFHAFRRAWAMSRKHHPVIDVAAAGGWKSTATLQRCYQQPDEATMLSVGLGAREKA